MAVFFVTLIWLLVAEVLVRLVIPQRRGEKEEFKSIFKASDNAILNYEMRPNYMRAVRHLGDEKIVYATNQQGFRDGDFSLAKEKDIFRIAILGDSITFGIGVQQKDTFGELLERQLGALGVRAQVLNFGVGGYNTIQEEELLKSAVITYSPDLVVLGYALNDADERSDWFFEADKGRINLKILPVSAYRGPLGGRLAVVGPFLDRSALYGFLTETVRRLSSTPPLGDEREMTRLEREYRSRSSAWRERRESLLRMAARVRESGGNFLVVVLPLAYQLENPSKEWQSQKSIWEYTSSEGILAVDLLGPLLSSGLSPREIFLDAGHFTRLGNLLVAENIVTGLWRFNLVGK